MKFVILCILTLAMTLPAFVKPAPHNFRNHPMPHNFIRSVNV